MRKEAPQCLIERFQTNGELGRGVTRGSDNKCASAIVSVSFPDPNPASPAFPLFRRGGVRVWAQVYTVV